MYLIERKIKPVVKCKPGTIYCILGGCKSKHINKKRGQIWSVKKRPDKCNINGVLSFLRPMSYSVCHALHNFNNTVKITIIKYMGISNYKNL